MTGPPFLVLHWFLCLESLMAEQFIIYCDESSEKGEFCSHFYGGALVRADDRQAIEAIIAQKKAELNIAAEFKWSRVSEPYAQKYIDLMDMYFDLIEAGRIKIRIMFTQNVNVPPELPEEKVDNEYFLLYYQFIKHAFGLRYWDPQREQGQAHVSVYLDDPPQNAKKFDNFKSYLAGLSEYPVFTAARVKIAKEDITGVSSKEHGIMQGLDVILGGMQSKLNQVHTRPHPPAKRRSKRARAKERVYEKIRERIFRLYPRFNVGVSTGVVTITDRWDHAYRHWCFVPTGSTMDRSRAKKR